MKVIVVMLFCVVGCARTGANLSHDMAFKFIGKTTESIRTGDVKVSCGYESIVKTEPYVVLKGFHCEIAVGTETENHTRQYSYDYLTFPDSRIHVLGMNGDVNRPDTTDIVVLDSEMNLVIVRRKS